VHGYRVRMVAHASKPVLALHTVEEWARWLEDPEHPGGVRLRLRKKDSAAPGFRYAEALDAALCVGWIDGQTNGLDTEYYTVAFQPRRPRSVWSQVNREHVARLIAEGRMRPAGLAEVERAQADGRWDAAYRQKDAVVPDDLRAALDADPAASEAFAGLSAQNRFAILFRLGNLKRADTRARRVDEFVAQLARGETPHPQPERRGADG
jgi:uncharacterized protein YdeI (YjbR/CyaY-like superfamily)